MNTDKAYLLGLIIGGGIFGNAEDVFRIRLPYKQWGSYKKNPQQAGTIARDILNSVSGIFRAVYKISVSYSATEGGEWNILCEGDISELKNDLSTYGIMCEGELRQNAKISSIIVDLIDDNLKRRFIAGLADTIGSLAPSQRRFSDNVQIMSFELKGDNFSRICELCRLLYSINCIPDQILWNHPNFHCGDNPYYRQWHKGFKLRVLLDQYALTGSFAFRAKVEAFNANRKLQQHTNNATPCSTRKVKTGISSIHPAENDKRLPERIRGGHYLHYQHVCAVLGCEHAPYSAICNLFKRIGELVTPFPILYKDKLEQVKNVVSADVLLSGRTYITLNISIKSLLDQYQANHKARLYGTTLKNGYPIAEVMQAIAYTIADDSELFGKRPRGGFIEVIERHITTDPNMTIEILRPDLLTPLVIMANGRGALVGAENPEVYARLVTRAPDNEYKLCVRNIKEEDLRNAQ